MYLIKVMNVCEIHSGVNSFALGFWGQRNGFANERTHPIILVAKLHFISLAVMFYMPI